MKIAVASQNRKNITEHAGRCRKFWLFRIEDSRISGKELVEFPKELSFHESSPHEAHPLDDVDILIAADMGQGLMNRLERKGITGLITTETDPERAVSLYLQGSLHTEPPNPHAHGHNHGEVRVQVT